MMKKIIISALAGLILLAVFFILRMSNFLSIDHEDELEKTRKALNQQSFSNLIFEYAPQFEEFTGFWMRNGDKVMFYNRHSDGREIRLTKHGFFGSYTNDRPCFGLFSFHSSFLESYIPPDLRDSLLFYYSKFSEGLIESIKFCPPNADPNNSLKNKGTVQYKLNSEMLNVDIPSTCYSAHAVVFNARTSKSEFDESYIISKDSLLTPEHRYVISFWPYLGI
jgi:hypothetical protein